MQLLRPLLDPGGPCFKASSQAHDWRAKGNHLFGKGDFGEALLCYTKALQHSPMTTAEERKAAAAIFTNRALSLQKLNLHREALGDCSEAIWLHAAHSKAWYRRGCVNAALGHSGLAEADLEQALALEKQLAGTAGSLRQVAAELERVRASCPSDAAGPPPESGGEALEQALLGGAQGSNGPGGGNRSSASACGAHVQAPLVVTSKEAGSAGVAAKGERGAGEEHVGGATDASSASSRVGAELAGPSSWRAAEAVAVEHSASAGRSLRAATALKAGDLIIAEPPFAAVVHKSFRSARCHHCFAALPPNPTPCSACSHALYCRPACRQLATRGSPWCPGLDRLGRNSHEGGTPPGALEGHQEQANSARGQGQEQGWGPHVHECGGGSWAAVLPAEAALAARVLVACQLGRGRSRAQVPLPSSETRTPGGLAPAGTSGPGIQEEEEGGEEEPRRPVEGDRHAAPSHVLSPGELCHHLDKASPDERVEMALLAIVTASCLQHSLGALFTLAPLAGPSRPDGAPPRIAAGEVLTVLAQLRANSMAVVELSGLGQADVSRRIGPGAGAGEARAPVINGVEQLAVAQGLYLSASLLNHACDPTVAASFTGGHLAVRAVRDVPAGSQLSLCYGPQKGEKTRGERRQWLVERYFFRCACPSCSRHDPGNLTLRGYRCTTPGCMGVVPRAAALQDDLADLESAADEAETALSVLPGSEGEGLQSSGGEVQDNKETRSNGRALLPSQRPSGAAKRGVCTVCGAIVDATTLEKLSDDTWRLLVREQQKLQRAAAAAAGGGGGASKPPSALESEAASSSMREVERCLKRLRAVVHPASRRVAEAEDAVAEAMCAAERFQEAAAHSLSALTVLKQHYPPSSIVIAHEYAKLASIHVAAGDAPAGEDARGAARKIYCAHYGARMANKIIA
eukprot:jgi/Mesen1/6017/ME000306S05286